MKLRERRVGEGSALAAQVSGGDPRRRVDLRDRGHVVEILVLRQRPLQPVNVALRFDHRAGAFTFAWASARARSRPSGLSSWAAAVEIISSLESRRLIRPVCIASSSSPPAGPGPDLVADEERRGQAVYARAIGGHDAQEPAAVLVA